MVLNLPRISSKNIRVELGLFGGLFYCLAKSTHNFDLNQWREITGVLAQAHDFCDFAANFPEITEIGSILVICDAAFYDMHPINERADNMTVLPTVDYLAPDAAQQFVESLRTYGFGVLKNHPIQKELVQSIYDNWYAFFQTEQKNEFLFSKETQDGFFPASVSEIAKGHTKRDIKEYFHIYPWGRIPEHLKDQAMQYYREANAFAAKLLSWVEDYAPADVRAKFSQSLPSMIEDSDQTLLRVLHYPPMLGDVEPGAIRAAAHGDINLLTVLPASNEPGLQVMGSDGNWIDVPCDFGNLIINIGDMLQEASGGYYPSTIHRVINPTGERVEHSRISLPLFLHPRPDVVLSERHTAHSYLEERLRELGVK